MKALLAKVLLYSISLNVQARPSQRIVDACLKTESTSITVKYAELENSGFSNEADEDAKKTSITRGHGKNVAGIWEVESPRAFGLVYNGSEIDLKKVTALDKRQVPAQFDIYQAVWGEAREGSNAYLCITFNFEGVGQSGSFQNVRGVYLIDTKASTFKPFYTIGDIRKIEK
jgi:hypothetical protein